MQTPRIIFDGQTTKGLAVQLRYPVRDDLDALWKYINVLSKEQTFLIFQGEEISLEDETGWLNAKLDQIARKQSIMLLAFHADELIGCAEIDMLHGVKRHIGDFGISIAQPYRGRGVGELLMQNVIESAYVELPGLEIITLEVFGNNAVAMNLYQKLGFKEFGRIPGGIIHRAAYIDAVYMVRVRNPIDLPNLR